MTRRRLSTVIAAAAVALLGMAGSAQAAPIIWDFNPGYPPYGGPFTGPVGASSYTVDSFPATGLLLTAAGFDIPENQNLNELPYPPRFGDAPHVGGLYWKDLGVDEHGIGLVGTADNELTLHGNPRYPSYGYPANYNRIDLNNIYKNPAVMNAQIRVQSTTGFEAWDLYGWDGLNYFLLESGNLDNNVFRPLPFWGVYPGYAVAVTPNPAHPANNVLFDAISAEIVPEPGTIALLGGGLAMLASRRRASRSARK